MAIVMVLIIAFASSTLNAQNLIRNGGFEEYDQCALERVFHALNGYVTDWNTNNLNSGIHAHRDCNDLSTFLDNVPFDSLSPYAGDGILLFANSRRNWSPGIFRRTYAYSRLLSPLEADSFYYLSYYIHFNRHYDIGSHFGAIFVRDSNELVYTNFGDTIRAIIRDDFIGIRDTFYGPDAIYHKVEGCYQARGGEEYIYLGSFLPPDEINWHPTHVPYLSRGGDQVLLDEVSLIKVSMSAERDQNVDVCDGESIRLPLAQNSGTRIVDDRGREVDSLSVMWPNDYLYYYEDPCFGRLGEILVSSQICEEPLAIRHTLCEEERIDLRSLLPQNYVAVNEDGVEITEFRAVARGDYRFITRHERYGDWGDLIISVVACENCSVYLPNVMNLQSAWGNDSWQPLTACSYEFYSLKIYDRWGGLVFSTTDPDFSWDGRRNGKICETGVYIYDLFYTFRHPIIPQEPTRKVGDLLLLR